MPAVAPVMRIVCLLMVRSLPRNERSFRQMAKKRGPHGAVRGMNVHSAKGPKKGRSAPNRLPHALFRLIEGLFVERDEVLARCVNDAHEGAPDQGAEELRADVVFDLLLPFGVLGEGVDGEQQLLLD